jgi:uncharacterized repeat protein (TIGR03803 family)
MLRQVFRCAVVSAVLSLIFCMQVFAGETILHNFNPQNHGGMNPSGGLLMDSAGNFYGSALDGTIFEFTGDGSGGWNYNVLCNCPSTYGFGSLAMDDSGNLYGSTYWGEVYQYSPGGAGGWTATRIYAFTGGSGFGPSPVILDSAGNLYGTYSKGGSHGHGYVFELARRSDGTWSLTHLHDFNGSDGSLSAANDAYALLGGLIMDQSGNLYGTTGQGGSSSRCTGGCGVVFELSKSGSQWTEKVLHSFTGSDGSNPDAPLLLDASENLYGTTTSGGTNGFGVVFRTSATGQTKDLYNFTNKNGDGAYPNSALVMDTAGNLFGTTLAGGGSTSCTVENDNGCGTVFELKNNAGTYSISVLLKFSGKANGGFPGGVLLGTDGNLYGLAEVGGGDNNGLFFEIPQ